MTVADPVAGARRRQPASVRRRAATRPDTRSSKNLPELQVLFGCGSGAVGTGVS